MYQPNHSRKRGVVLSCHGLQKLQTAKSQAEIRENLTKGYTLEALSLRTKLTPNTLTKVLAGDVGVDKHSLSRCFRGFNLVLKPEDYEQQPGNQKVAITSNLSDVPVSVSPNLPVTGAGQFKNQNYVDWSTAPDVSAFYGRSSDLSKLREWILKDRCRLVALCGMAGIGKTWLSVKLAEQIQDEFEFVIWRSLRHAPPIHDFLVQLIRLLSPQSSLDLGQTFTEQISQLIELFRASRCLLLLDNAETIFQGHDKQSTSRYQFAGYCRPEYEGYGELLKQIGESRHQSCLVLTSREKPNEIKQLAGEDFVVRGILVKGLSVSTVQAIFQTKGVFQGTEDDWHRLVEYYAGNPLMLKLASITIQAVFAGNIASFLDQHMHIWGNICDLFDQQMLCLSEAEIDILSCLAAQTQPICYMALRVQLSPSMATKTLLEALESLAARSLIEPKDGYFLLQPFLVEYMTNCFRLQVYSYNQLPQTNDCHHHNLKYLKDVEFDSDRVLNYET